MAISDQVHNQNKLKRIRRYTQYTNTKAVSRLIQFSKLFPKHPLNRLLGFGSQRIGLLLMSLFLHSLCTVVGVMFVLIISSVDFPQNKSNTHWKPGKEIRLKPIDFKSILPFSSTLIKIYGWNLHHTNEQRHYKYTIFTKIFTFVYC